MRNKRCMARVLGVLYVLGIALLCAAKPATAATPCQICAQTDPCFDCCLCGGNSVTFCFDHCTPG